MSDPLAFLKSLKTSPPPAVVHLGGDDAFVRETVRGRIVAAWTDDPTGSGEERLVGSKGAGELRHAMGGGGLFAEKKALLLTDPGPGEKGGNLAQMGKNQLRDLKEAVEALPRDINCLVIETGALKKTGALHKLLAGVATPVDASPPQGAARRRWIQILARRAGVQPSARLLEAMVSSRAPLATLAPDLEKVSLATAEGEEAEIETWIDLTQADPEATVWEIGEHLGAGRSARVLESLGALRGHGMKVYEILPALLTWNQQRLQIKSFEARGGRGAPPGVPPFVLRKTQGQLRNMTLNTIRREQRELLYLDRCSKQSWEDPEIVLEKFLLKAALGGRR